MDTQIQERAYTSDTDAYECFVGQITPQEFVAGFEEFDWPIGAAIESLLRQWPWDDEMPPSWLGDALYRYVESRLEEG
jgi:hypothetical protein